MPPFHHRHALAAAFVVLLLVVATALLPLSETESKAKTGASPVSAIPQRSHSEDQINSSPAVSARPWQEITDRLETHPQSEPWLPSADNTLYDPTSSIARFDTLHFDGLSEVHQQMARRLSRRQLGRLPGSGATNDDDDPSVPWICFAPGTNAEVMQALTGSPHGHRATANLGTGGSGEFSAAAFQFFPNPRWTDTATNNTNFFNRLQQGDATVLTWSIVDDGLSIPGSGGEPTSDSDLRAWLNNLYPGGEAEWLPLFEQVFDRWSEVSGVKYVYMPNDSGSFPNSSGNNNRGDIRIAGHPIDGPFNTLAYNFGPNGGDMVIDTSDSYFNSTAANSRRLRNVIAHEHGHGLGMAHVCPQNFTKLMEPSATTAFDGPQHDDIYSAQRQYGDRYEDPDLDSNSEDNDAFNRSADLGSLAAGTHLIDLLSIDDNSDEDYLRFTPENPDLLMNIELRPVGLSYLEGGQNNDGSCSAGTTFNSLAQHDLSLEVINAGGTTIASADANGSGLSETINNLTLPSGDIVLFIDGDSTDRCQLYEIEITLLPPPNTPNLVINNSSADEASGSLSFNITLDEAPTIPASVDVTITGGTASDGADFFGGSITLNYPVGVTDRILGVTLINDSDAEADETVVLNFSNPQSLELPANPQATGTILDDDALAQLPNSGMIMRGPGNSAEITWLAIPGRTYEVEFSEDLVTWMPLPGFESITIIDGTESAIDPGPLVVRRFYRVNEAE